MIINADILKKYDVPGPRYTSYPTAPHFDESFTHKSFADEIVRTQNGNSLPNLSLYFHLPFCDTLCYFCGCNMLITRDRNRVKKYISYLLKEIDLLKKYIPLTRKVAQLHWGGGTPTHLTPEEIEYLISYINNSFEFNAGSENGCEIDPRGLTKEHLIALKEGGFNRISMGVQDFDEQVQKSVNRIQPEEMTREVVGWVRELGFLSINLDLMYGLPFQSLNGFQKTLDATIDISPDRIAVFNYAHVPWMKKHQALIHPENLPTPEEKLDILKLTIEKLTSAGYVFIGMDHFAKPDDEMAVALREKKMYRNFQGYSTNAGCDLFAFGITAISQLENIYAQNYKTEKEYFTALDSSTLPTWKGYRLNDDDQIRRFVIMKLMCDFELNIPKIEDELKIYFNKYFNWGLKNLEKMVDDDLLVINSDSIQVTEMGRLLIRNIAMIFDGYIERHEDKAKYSRTV
ncbi:MAG: oxygen-independent coproporphyrinogen III oxidase [Bacteroidetes bacterium]|nr:oxygen-independent coproporphyrinogen III oxidase [Bacteroidota bacterium]